MKKRYSNLLSSKFRLIVLIRRRLTLWSLAWIATLLISFGWWQIRSLQVNAAEERVALMETRCGPLKQMQTRNEIITRQLAELNSHESLLTRLDDEQIPYSMLALVSQQIGARRGTVRIESFQLTQIDRPATETAAVGGTLAQTPASPVTVTQLTVRGIAVDNLAVSQFVAGLRDTGVFDYADLKSSVGAHVDNQRAQNFIIICGY